MEILVSGEFTRHSPPEAIIDSIITLNVKKCTPVLVMVVRASKNHRIQGWHEVGEQERCPGRP